MRRFIATLLAAAAIVQPVAAATFVSSYAVTNGTDLSGYAGVGQNRLGGFGSDLVYNAADGLFYGLTDRGPGGGVLDYQPRIQAFSLGLDANGAITGFTLAKTTLFTDAGGAAYSGLNPALLNGNSGTLGRSLDSEGLVRLANGNFLVSDEYGPSVMEFNASGQLLRTFATPANLVPRTSSGATNYVDARPTITTGRQDNRGLEGLTVTPDGKTAYAILQDPLVQEGSTDGRFSRNVRIVAYDVATGESTGQFIYQLESRTDINDRIADDFGQNNQGRSIGVSSIQALGNGKFLVLERDNRGWGVEDPTGTTEVGSKRIYQIDITGATNVAGISLAGTNALPAGVRAVNKTSTPYLDIAAALKAQGLTIPEKLEGFTFGPRLADGSVTLILITDNDYSVTQNGSGTQFDICTTGTGAGNTSTQIALGSACPTGSALIPTLIYSFRLSAAEYDQLTGAAAAVPEPSSWALAIAGFGLVGGGVRRRRRPVAMVA